MTGWKQFISLVVLSSICQLERGVICKSCQSDISSLSDACHIPARLSPIVSKVLKELWVAGNDSKHRIVVVTVQRLY